MIYWAIILWYIKRKLFNNFVLKTKKIEYSFWNILSIIVFMLQRKKLIEICSQSYRLSDFNYSFYSTDFFLFLIASEQCRFLLSKHKRKKSKVFIRFCWTQILLNGLWVLHKKDIYLAYAQRPFISKRKLPLIERPSTESLWSTGHKL